MGEIPMTPDRYARFGPNWSGVAGCDAILSHLVSAAYLR
jgi:hypothetical protein